MIECQSIIHWSRDSHLPCEAIVLEYCWWWSACFTEKQQVPHLLSFSLRFNPTENRTYDLTRSWHSSYIHYIYIRLHAILYNLKTRKKYFFFSPSRKDCTRGCTVKIKIVFTLKNRVECYLHLGLHGKGYGPWFWPDVLLVLCCFRWWWYEGRRKSDIQYIYSSIYRPELEYIRKQRF